MGRVWHGHVCMFEGLLLASCYSDIESRSRKVLRIDSFHLGCSDDMSEREYNARRSANKLPATASSLRPPCCQLQAWFWHPLILTQREEERTWQTRISRTLAPLLRIGTVQKSIGVCDELSGRVWSLGFWGSSTHPTTL